MLFIVPITPHLEPIPVPAKASKQAEQLALASKSGSLCWGLRVMFAGLFSESALIGRSRRGGSLPSEGDGPVTGP